MICTCMYACYVYNATRYGARGHELPHTLGRTAEPGLGSTLVAQGDDGGYIADRGRGDAVEELRKAWRARSMKDSMLSLS